RPLLRLNAAPLGEEPDGGDAGFGHLREPFGVVAEGTGGRTDAPGACRWDGWLPLTGRHGGHTQKGEGRPRGAGPTKEHGVGRHVSVPQDARSVQGRAVLDKPHTAHRPHEAYYRITLRTEVVDSLRVGPYSTVLR